MTQIGKAIHRTAESIDVAEALNRIGKALYSKARREKGVRVVGGGAVDENDWGLALHQNGTLSLHAVSSLFESGTIPVDGEILSFTVFSKAEGVLIVGIKVGLDFGTSNSGIAVSDGQNVRLLPIDPQNVLPEVIKTILYVTREYQHYIGQEAIELYYKHNINRIRRYEMQWAGAIRVVASEVDYMHDVFVEVDVLKPGRLLQYLKTALRKGAASGGIDGTLMFERYYHTGDLVQAYLSVLKARAEDVLDAEISSVTLGRPVKFSEDPEQDRQSEETLRQAALDAGFKEVDFEFEPVAAALFYERSLTEPQNVLIFDFGGGTLDIAIMRLGDPAGRQVFANGGVDIAGSDFDRAIIEKRLLPHFGWGKVHHRPEITDLIEAVPDWAALPELSTPIARRNLEKAILAKIAPDPVKELTNPNFR